MDRDGRPYAAVLWQADLSAEAGRVEAVAMRLVRYVTDGSLVAPRNLTLPSWPVDILPLLLSVALLAAGWRWSRRRREVVTWAILSALTFAFAASSGYSQWPHHFAFPLLLLVFALALCLDGLPARGRLAAAALAVVFWATLGARLPSTAFSAEASPTRTSSSPSSGGGDSTGRPSRSTRAGEPTTSPCSSATRNGWSSTFAGSSTIRRNSGRWRSSPGASGDRCSS